MAPPPKQTDQSESDEGSWWKLTERAAGKQREVERGRVGEERRRKRKRYRNYARGASQLFFWLFKWKAAETLQMNKK